MWKSILRPWGSLRPGHLDRTFPPGKTAVRMYDSTVNRLQIRTYPPEIGPVAGSQAIKVQDSGFDRPLSCLAAWYARSLRFAFWWPR